MAPAEVVDPLIYDGLVEELIDVLEMKEPYVQVSPSALFFLIKYITLSGGTSGCFENTNSYHPFRKRSKVKCMMYMYTCIHVQSCCT